jgi:hypothetical protein
MRPSVALAFAMIVAFGPDVVPVTAGVQKVFDAPSTK